MLTARRLAALCLAASLCSVTPMLCIPAAHAAQPLAIAPQERIAAIKEAFAKSQATLKQYEWIETTTTSLKGEEKAQVQKRCYYGAEGTLQKVEISQTPTEEPGRGIRGRIREHRKEELTDYMKDAGALVHEYLPPSHDRIQACKDGERASFRPASEGRPAAIVLTDYLKSGDTLTIDINMADNRVQAIHIDTLLGKDKDPVKLDVLFSSLPDGTIYTATSTLNAEAKNVTVVTENTGYRKLGS